MTEPKRKARILVIDPDGDVEPWVSNIVSESGCEVACAESDGLLHDTFSYPHPFAVAVLAVSERTSHLFGMIPALRKLSPTAEVILMSRSADERMWADALAHGACDLFSMPPDPKQFSNVLLKVINRSEKTAELLEAVDAA
jgi:DNA-binding NtrC family response regulator